MRYKEFLLEYSREKTLANDNLMTKVMAAVKRKDPTEIGRRGIDIKFDDPENREYILDKFELIDPTPNKQYIQPLMNWYQKDKFRGFEDSQRLKDALGTFLRFKQRLVKRDINQYTDITELEDAVEEFKDEGTKKQKRQQGEYHIDPSSYDVFAESARYVVVTPNTSQASCSFGAGTKWCTASKNSSEYFDEYKQEGPLYIIRTKDANYDKDSIIATSNPIYQFHFESGQFMNVQDRPIVLNDRDRNGLVIDNELYSIFKEKFADALSVWMEKFFELRENWEDFQRDAPITGVIGLMEEHNRGDGLKAVNGMLDSSGFTHWRKHYYERYKDLDMFDFIRGINEVINTKIKKDGALKEYAERNNSDRKSWWEVTKADIRLNSEIGEYLRLQTYNIYDHEIGGWRMRDMGGEEERGRWRERGDMGGEESLEKIDKHFTRQKSIAIHLKAFQDILSEFGGESADFAEGLQEWVYEYKRIHHWIGGWGMQGWMEKYLIPKILEKQGHSEDEIQRIIFPFDNLIQKFVRDDIMNGTDYKQTWQGLI